MAVSMTERRFGIAERITGITLDPSKSPQLNGDMHLVAIAGSRGKSTVACMLESVVSAAGLASAAWLSSGVYALGERMDGELGPWQRVLFAVRHGEIDLAIQEMHAPTVVAVGLPTEMYPMAIVTTICGNHESCLIAPETRTERTALDTVIRSVRRDGVIVAGADDFTVAEAVLTSDAEPLLFAMRRESPVLQRHLAAGGYGAWTDEEELCIGSDDEHTRVLALHDIPATLNGTLVFQVQNALAAALAAWSMGIPVNAIRAGLQCFSPDPARQPAACNIIEYNRAKIIVDAPTQIWSLRMLMRGIRNLPRRRTMVVSGDFPDLPPHDVEEAGRLLASIGAIIVLHADPSAPDRLEALRSGIASSPTIPLVVLADDELQAIDHMLNKVGPDDVALVLAGNEQRALTHLWPAPAISVPTSKVRERGDKRCQ